MRPNPITQIYQKVKATLASIIPAPVATKRVNPYLAAGLELFGFIGVLGLGRMYAGNVRGGIAALIGWLGILIAGSSAIFLIGVAALLLAIPTLGLSLLFSGLLAAIIVVPIILVPVGSAIQLFIQLR